MQDRFTRQALQALKLAKATAQSWKHSYIGTEHILAGLLKENDYAIGNIDATIIAQKPKMAPHIPTMRENIAEALGIKISQLNIKATTEEGLGFTGENLI